LTKIVDEKLVEEEDFVEVDTPEQKEPDVPRSKMLAMMEIIKGIVPTERRRVDVSIPNLMKGTHLMPDTTYNKVLIFANYDETIRNIKTSLTEEKIDYWQLSGTHREITATVALFTDCKKTCVLIVNSTKHCAGLNLQTATDLIFAHKIIDPNVETQVIGRGQRLGRTSRIRVHFMMYQNEFDWMVRNNTIREIPDTDETDVEIMTGFLSG
jgi:SNF2 family DNA or RNA helicase